MLLSHFDLSINDYCVLIRCVEIPISYLAFLLKKKTCKKTEKKVSHLLFIINMKYKYFNVIKSHISNLRRILINVNAPHYGVCKKYLIVPVEAHQRSLIGKLSILHIFFILFWLFCFFIRCTILNYFKYNMACEIEAFI